MVEPGGLPSMGRTDSDTTEVTWWQQQQCSIVYMHCIFFIHSSFDGHLGCIAFEFITPMQSIMRLINMKVTLVRILMGSLIKDHCSDTDGTSVHQD